MTKNDAVLVPPAATPVLFDSDTAVMVRAGTKSQRRWVAPAWMDQTDAFEDGPRDAVRRLDPDSGEPLDWGWWQSGPDGDREWHPTPISGAGPGDQLYVRESHAFIPHTVAGVATRKGIPVRKGPEDEIHAGEWAAARSAIVIASLPGEPAIGSWAPGNWRPAIYMPRWASTMVLRVDRVWVHRLQDITPVEVAAEGLGSIQDHAERRATFVDFWDRRNGQGSWGRDPLVVAVEWVDDSEWARGAAVE